MKKVQYSYLPADSAAAGNPREAKKSNQPENGKTPPRPDEATVARLNKIAQEYPFCAWGKPRHNSLL